MMIGTRGAAPVHGLVIADAPVPVIGAVVLISALVPGHVRETDAVLMIGGHVQGHTNAVASHAQGHKNAVASHAQGHKNAVASHAQGHVTAVRGHGIVMKGGLVPVVKARRDLTPNLLTEKMSGGLVQGRMRDQESDLVPNHWTMVPGIHAPGQVFGRMTMTSPPQQRRGPYLLIRTKEIPDPDHRSDRYPTRKMAGKCPHKDLWKTEKRTLNVALLYFHAVFP